VTLQVLVACVASAYAGVGVVTPQVQAEALRLWERFCGPRSEGGNDGGVSVYCKVATEDVRDVQQHTLNIPSRQAGQQVVFVQPPSVHTKHDVVVTGGGGAAPKTVIYVKPAKNTNEVNIIDQTQPAAAPQKPSLYFLKETDGEGSQNNQAADDPVSRRPNAEQSQDFPPAGDRTAQGRSVVRVTRGRNEGEKVDQESRASDSVTRRGDGGSAAPQPIIFIKRAKQTNEFNIVDQTQAASAPQTPSIFFLKKKREADQSSNNTYRVTQTVSVHSSRAAHQVSQ
jgi:hypothetical protein